MNVASIVGMVGLAVLGLLLGWWLGKSAETRAVNTCLQAKRRSSRAKRQNSAASSGAKDLESRNTATGKRDPRSARGTRPQLEMEKDAFRGTVEGCPAIAGSRKGLVRRPKKMIGPIRLKSLAADAFSEQKRSSFSEWQSEELARTAAHRHVAKASAN